MPNLLLFCNWIFLEIFAINEAVLPQNLKQPLCLPSHPQFIFVTSSMIEISCCAKNVMSSFFFPFVLTFLVCRSVINLVQFLGSCLFAWWLITDHIVMITLACCLSPPKRSHTKTSVLCIADAKRSRQEGTQVSWWWSWSRNGMPTSILALSIAANLPMPATFLFVDFGNMVLSMSLTTAPSNASSLLASSLGTPLALETKLRPPHRSAKGGILEWLVGRREAKFTVCLW